MDKNLLEGLTTGGSGLVYLRSLLEKHFVGKTFTSTDIYQFHKDLITKLGDDTKAVESLPKLNNIRSSFTYLKKDDTLQMVKKGRSTLFNRYKLKHGTAYLKVTNPNFKAFEREEQTSIAQATPEETQKSAFFLVAFFQALFHYLLGRKTS